MGEDWEGLRRGSQNGFFMVILAFSWWVETMDGDTGLHDTLYDVLWVMKCMADMPASPDQPIEGKRAHVEAGGPIKKRCVFLFPITSQANRTDVTRRTK